MRRVHGRVAHLSTAHPARDNRIFHKECRALREAGLDTWLIVGQDVNETAAGVRIHGLPVRGSRLKRLVLGQMDAWLALRHVQPALVHVHDPELIPLVMLWKTIFHRKAIYDAHEDLGKQIEGKAYLPSWSKPMVRVLSLALIRLADYAADGVVAATPTIARKFRNGHTVVVHNYPWLREYPVVSAHPPGDRALVYVGAISEARGFSSMLGLIERIADARLVLAGPVASDVAEEVERLSVGSDVSYLGHLSARAIPAVLRSAAIGLVLLKPLPNYLESLPTKLFEYMAAGIPFVASDFPYWRHLLEDVDCGRFVNVDDDLACATEIERLLDNPELCEALGRRGRNAVLQQFNFDQEAVNLVGMTRRILEGAEAGNDFALQTHQHQTREEML